MNWRDPWHPEGGGSELYVHQVAKELRDSGRRLTWVTASYPGAARDEVVDGIRFIRRGGHLTIYLWVAWMFLSGSLRRRTGGVDAVLEVQNGMPFLASWLTRSKVVVLVHHVHREQWSVVGPVLARIGWLLESRVAVLANRGHRYVAVSDVTRRELIDLGVRAGDISLAYNGMPPVPAFEAQERAAAPTLVVLSRLVPHKQIDHVITALPELAGEFPDVRLRILGDGWWGEQLRSQATALGLDDRIDFLGHVSDRTKFEELSSAWVHVLPSVKEGWGLSIVEAGHVGTPSVAYASAGGVTEAILDGVTGLLADDEADLTVRLGAVLRDSRLRDELGHKALVRSGEFTWEAAARVIAGAIDEA
ncbi:glycosyltransferase family 4 protein [Nocardioides marmoriginsengisoli]|uniref:glycosyltransferase family 4 protein n=1 Tax=Nocardioides marmoriginsengisoli TaxID=661483 RepID=UPI001621D45A|nr:glycosyltransferase family 4 protein [Nocardioides marmoriginsengisoli]